MDFLEYAKSQNATLPLVITAPEDINKALPLLRFPLDENAIQESKAGENGKTYDAKGYSYQAHIDRMNLVFGVNWRFEMLNETVEETASWDGRRSFRCQGDMLVSIGYYQRNPETRLFDWIPVYTVPSVPTGHENTERDSARKGAQTKGIKRATSILGVGADAYLGILDDDMTTGMPMQQPTGNEPSSSGHRYKKGLEWEQQSISEPEYNGLMILADKKGFSSEKLHTFYSGKSEGEISDPPATLTKGQLATVKMMLGQLPDYVAAFESAASEEDPEQAGIKWPATQEELLAVDETLFRQIASEFSLQIPETMTARNRGAMTKALWTLMENKRKAAKA